VIPRAAAVAGEPNLAITFVRLSIHLEAVITVALLLVELVAIDTEDHFMIIGQRHFCE
jgi:hypothetical protein